MYELTIIYQDGCTYVDSREVADFIGKQHKYLLREIRWYCKILMESTTTKFILSDFFVESAYCDINGRTLPMFLITKAGCDLIASRFAGAKGVMFSIAYITKFRELESAASSAIIKPTLGEYNDSVRIITKAMRSVGATSNSIIDFVKSVYEPLGINIAIDDIGKTTKLYTAKQIALMPGMYSINGNPHYQAVSAILNEIIFIDEGHKKIVTSDYGNHIGVSVRYDDYAFEEVESWLEENNFPEEIYGFDRTFYVLYLD